MGRPRSCHCGACSKCRHAERQRRLYQAKSLAERRAIIAARDPQKLREAARRRANERTGEAETKAQARHAVARALHSGRLLRGVCEVGANCEGRIEAHHDDYARPLDVRWLCRLHHGQVHGELGNNNADKDAA